MVPAEGIKLKIGDCREVMAQLDPDSVDAIVTDPPYGLGFMGKGWDHGVPGLEFWREALRVAKPGAHLLAFGGTRTFHRLASAIEDAGWEIRDCLGWLYGSGFPKSLDVSKAIDKAAGALAHEGRGMLNKETGRMSLVPTIKPSEYVKPKPATESAKKWQGWGTALKPAWEPIVMARKPLAGTVAANVLEHGTGGINVDGCRVEVDPQDPVCKAVWHCNGERTAYGKFAADGSGEVRSMFNPSGRWPANILHDGSEDVDAVLGEAKRFFYCPKASKADRGPENRHPTVKPSDLMAYLVRMVTPPGGLVLDPFAGSGTTGVACVREGFRALLIEQEEAYAATIVDRISKEASK